jgi:hypothetical protein
MRQCADIWRAHALPAQSVLLLAAMGGLLALLGWLICLRSARSRVARSRRTGLARR